MNVIYVATTSIPRYRGIARTIRLIDNNIEIKDIFRLNIIAPQEKGKNESEIARQKVVYYQKILKNNVLCEDDGIYFAGVKDKFQIKHLVHRKNIKIGQNKLDFWLKYLRKHRISSGILKKVFALSVKNRCFVEKVQIPIKFCYQSSNKNESRNIFNELMIPDKFTKSFSEMGEKEKVLFSKLYLVYPLKKLLLRLRLFSKK